MKKLLLLLLMIGSNFGLKAYADQSYTVRCDVGGTVVQTAGLGSTNKVEGSFPGCSVSVFNHGTTTPSAIFSDNGVTPESNPFTTSLTTGYGIFYAANGRYDVVISGSGITSPVTISDILLNDFASAAPLGFCTVAFSATPTFNSTSCNIFLMILTGNVTSSSYSGAAQGQQAIFLLQQDAVGGRTFTWPTTMIDTPSLNQTANAFSNYYFVADSVPKFHLVSGGSGVLIGSSIVNGAGTVTIPSSGTSNIQANSTTVAPSTCASNTFTTQINSSGVLVCSAALTALTAPSHQFFNAVTSGGVFSAAQATLSDVAAGTAGSGTYDFSGVTLFKGRVGTGLTTSANGDFGFDTTNNNWHAWNGADRLVGLFEGSVTSGDCLKVSITSNRQSVQDNGGPCAATIASVSHNFLTSYTSTTGVFTQAQPAFTDISGTASAAQLPNPTASTLGGIESLAAVTSKWINTISTSGVPSATQPAASDISPGSNGQCLITTGGAAAWGSCSGTSADTILSVTANISSVSTSTTAQQNFSNTFTPSGSQIPNTVGSKFRIRSAGTFQMATGATTINFGFSVAGGAFLVTVGPTTPGTAAAHVWSWIAIWECLNTGSATYQCTGELRYTDNSLATEAGFLTTALATAVPYSRASSLGVAVQFSTASTNNVAIQNEFQIEQLN